MKKILLIAFGVLLLANCGGGGGGEVGTDNPPDIAGSYSCISGCTGICSFDNNTVASQNGSQIALTSISSTSTGTINNDGVFSIASSSCTCEGQITGATAVVDCTCNGTTCQAVTYQR